LAACSAYPSAARRWRVTWTICSRDCRPPSLNRLIGLAWLANIFHGPRLAFDIVNDTRAFYKLFYGVDVSDADLGTLIAWADGKPPGMAARR
jgi:iron complex transport system substrate-binding protein